MLVHDRNLYKIDHSRVRFRSLADMTASQCHVRFPPESRYPSVPERGDIKVNLVCQLFDDLVGSGDKRGRHGEVKRLGDLEVDD